MEMDVAVTAVVVGTRHRKDMGDLDALAASVRDLGLLQPIVVQPDFTLIAGERRLRACRDVLKWETIPARVLDLDDLLLGERDENDQRKDLTLSERDALRKAIEARIGSRQGRRTDKSPQNTSGSTCGQLPTSSDGPAQGEKTRDFAAKKAGFASDREARRVAEAVANGVPELVEAMDAGEVKPSAAARISREPKARQKEIVAQAHAGEKAQEEPPAAVDCDGAPLPEKAVPAFDLIPDLNKLCRQLDDCRREVERLGKLPIGLHMHYQSVVHNVQKAKEALLASRPTHVCPYCKGRRAHCEACHGHGWVTKSIHGRAPKG